MSSEDTTDRHEEGGQDEEGGSQSLKSDDSKGKKSVKGKIAKDVKEGNDDKPNEKGSSKEKSETDPADEVEDNGNDKNDDSDNVSEEEMDIDDDSLDPADPEKAKELKSSQPKDQNKEGSSKVAKKKKGGEKKSKKEKKKEKKRRKEEKAKEKAREKLASKDTKSKKKKDKEDQKKKEEEEEREKESKEAKGGDQSETLQNGDKSRNDATVSTEGTDSVSHDTPGKDEERLSGVQQITTESTAEPLVVKSCSMNEEKKTDGSEEPGELGANHDGNKKEDAGQSSSEVDEALQAKERLEPAPVTDENIKRKPPENWDDDIEDKNPKEPEDEKKTQNNLGNESGGGLKGNETADKHQDGAGKRLMSSLFESAKFLLGFPPIQKTHFAFYVGVQYSASSVQLRIWNPYTNMDVWFYEMQPLDDHKIYWTLPVSCIHDQLRNLKFYYVVNASFGTFNNFQDLRPIGISRSHFSVFRYPRFDNEFNVGLFYFARYIYRRFCNKELTLKESLEEYDHINFGRPNFPSDRRGHVAKWISQELAVIDQSSEKAVFFAHVIQHFDGKLLQNLKNNKPLLKDLIQDGPAKLLADRLLESDKNMLKELVWNAEQLVSFLLRNDRCGVSLEYAVVLCYHFHVGILDHLKYNSNWSDDEEFLSKDEVYAILHSLNDKDRGRLLGFIVKKAPTISFTWKFYNGLLNAFPSYISSNSEMFKKTCTKLLLSRQAEKLPRVLQKTSWESIPDNFKPDFVGTFLDAVIDQIREKSAFLNAMEEEAVISFFTDEIVFSNEDAKTTFLEASKFPEMHTIVVSVLQNPNSSKCWLETKEEIRAEVYNSLIRQAFSPQTKQERGGKSKLHQVLDSLNEILIALEVCPCPKAREIVQEKCLQFFGPLELVDITEEFEVVKGCHQDVENIYLLCLGRCITQEVRRDHNHNNLVKMLKKLSTEDEGKSNKLERITQEILLSLCNETKALDATRRIGQQDLFKIFESVFINRNLWSALMDVEWQKTVQPPQMEALYQAITLFEDSLERRDITIKDLKRLSNQVDNQALLVKIHAFFKGGKGDLENLISSCIEEEKNVHKDLVELIQLLSFVKKITEKVVVVSDMEDILQETTSKMKNYEVMSLRDVLDEDYWSCAECLLKMRRRLRDLQEFQVFQNAAQKRLEYEFSSVDTDALSEKPKSSLQKVTTILTENGISFLKKTCEILFADAGSMPITEAKLLLSDVKDLEKELDFIRRLFAGDEIAKDAGKFLERFLKFPTIHRNVKVLNKVLKNLGLSFEEDFVSEFSSKCLEDYYDLNELYGATENVVHIEEPLHGSYGDVMKELSESTELIKLLRETANDDVRNLIDAVEEHSDNTVAAKEVSDFIEIHKFLSPVLTAEPRDFFKVLTKRLQDLSQDAATGIAARIKASGNNAHSLRNVYNNVANRGEMTKEIVSKALKDGRYKIVAKGNDDQDNPSFYHERDEEMWEYSLSYPEEEQGQGIKFVKHNMEKLQDLKSRALLIVNTEKKQQNTTGESVDFQSFIRRIDLLNEIVVTGEELQRSGHPRYHKYWNECKTPEEIEYVCEELKEELHEWEETVREARASKFHLNFFHTKQLWVLKKYFNGGDSAEEEVFSLLRFVDKTITREKVIEFQNSCKSIPEGKFQQQLEDVASRLKEFFGESSLFQVEVAEKDEKRGLSVVILDKDSTSTASVVMQIFENASPQPNRIFFCHGNSTWYEIDLFLRRCFQESSNTSSPYCLANVESLSTDLQFQLIDSIREFQRSTTDYWLVLICRGGEHHHIVNQFRECAKKIRGMTDASLKLTFRKLFPEVTMVTSDLPGLGKTELIHERALKDQKRTVCFSINGPVSREKLVHQLLDLGIKEDSLLHIDISEVDDPLLVDTFLFEFIVLGMVSSGTKLFHIPTRFIAIEVANTLQHSLRDSLTVTKCFHRFHEEWSFEKLVCSQEDGSAVQVVCQYLKAYDNRTLEKDSLTLKDLKQATPLKESQCRELISKYFSGNGDLSYNVLETFLNVLATQLRKFSASPFFRPENLSSALKDSSDVRVRLFEALKNVSVEFATRSVGACKEVQASALLEKDVHLRFLTSSQKGKSATKMVDRVKGMVKWADENHLVVMFQEAYSVSALFRELSKVPDQVKALFESQNEPLRNLGDLDEEELKEKLQKILFADTGNQIDSYVLTPDNILKMVLIIQRVRAGVPVIVMGETGCGKTSLVRYLAKSCGVPIKVLNFHAGIYEKDIVEFTKMQIKEAGKDFQKQVWVFFDEINTCDYLGLINDIICHRSLNGKKLPPNLVFIAACNPYCLRPSESITTAGLTGKNVTDEYSNLVYRVKPLPETMMDYVWDYGSLDPKDERAYIDRMVDELDVDDPELVVDLLSTSQAFIREVEGNPFCVSLRDVRRCIVLAKWFIEKIGSRPPLDIDELTRTTKAIYEEAQGHSVEDRSIVLALAHSYQSRIPSSDKRKEYRLKLEKIYTKNGQSYSAADLELTIRAEQEEYLARMELPEGTARNTALRENVFVILVCILNRIPVFVVGKPGCSKSLSMQVIRSNLRGKDSKDEFFKTLPQLLVVSYQGSESSTSEGILKVFEKAQKYKEHNKKDESIPVVLLDEVGLAEISKYNPLKVLHRILEPEEQEFPDVAVVGISNWALDAAKMNRAIHLSRPEPTCEDLKETGLAILEAQSADTSGDNPLKENALQGLSENRLDCLAQSYFEYQKDQIHDNFHGLRDYYSLIKCLSRSPTRAMQDEASFNTFRALQRNFGGLTMKTKTIEDIYTEKSKSLSLEGILETREEFPVTDLISDNLEDPSARHLMLITSGDSALTIMDKTLSDLSREKVIICGSKFEEDISEDYSYRILSRIILHMERDCVLVLRDLESVYGSLYDMLNQNYVVVGKKKNCRVALGAYSNPMCQVHDGFRCIVLVDEDKVDYTDPPFLNRFEKQLLRYSDVLNENEQNVITKLKRWTKDFCSVEKTDFKEREVFLGFHEDTLPSLVLLLRQRGVQSSDLLQICKEELMAIATPEGVLRSLRSALYKDDSLDAKAHYERYFFKTPVHKGLKGFIDCFSPTMQGESTVEFQSLKYFVMTHSSIHIDVEACLKGSLSCQVEKLGAFKSEKQLSKHIQMFWSDSKKELLIFQCKPNLDGEHISLMKSITEQQHESYIKTCIQEEKCPTKSICIIVHLQKGDPASGKTKHWQFNFLRDWKQATLDSLEEPDVPINKLLGKSVFDLMKTKTLPLRKIIADQLMWCFTRLKYPTSLSDQQSLDKQVTKLQSSKTMMRYLENLVLRWIQQHHDRVEEGEFWSSSLRTCDWQINVSCDKKKLLGSLAGAMLRYIDHLVRRPLAKAVYLIANRLTFDSCQRALSKGQNANERFLAELIQDKDLFNIDEVPDPQEPKCYVLTQTNCALNFPFSIIFYEKIASLREKYVGEWRDRFEMDDISPEKEANEDAKQEFFQELCTDIKNVAPQFFSGNWVNDNLTEYIEDIFDYISAPHSSTLSRDQRIKVLKAACVGFLTETPEPDVVLLLAQIHFSLWKHGSSFLAILQLLSICPSIFAEGAEIHSRKYVKQFGSMVRNAKKLEFVQGDDIDDDDDSDDGSDDGHDRDQEHDAIEKEPHKTRHDEESDEENDDDTFTEPFMKIIFDALCRMLIPTDILVGKLGSVQEWQTTANSFVSFVTKSGLEPTRVFYNLRVCSDFANMVLSPTHKPFSLYLLGAISEREGDESDLHNCFDKVLDIIEDIENPTKKADEFQISYLWRCLGTCDSDEQFHSIFFKACSFSKKDTLELASPLICQMMVLVIMAEEDTPFMDILKDSADSSSCYDFLQVLEKALTSAVEEQDGVQDCYLATICLEGLNRITHQDLDFSISEVSSSNSPTMERLKTAMGVVKESRKNQDILKLLTAVSYVRNALSSVAELVIHSPYVLKQETEYSSLLKYISSCLEAPRGMNTENPRKAGCMLYFLRVLRQQLSLYELRGLCEDSKMLPALKHLTWSDEISKAPVKIFKDVKMKKDYDGALFRLIEKGDSKAMKSMCDQLAADAKRRRAFASSLIDGLYLSHSSQTDTVDKAVESIIEFLPKNLPPVFKRLVLCLTGKEDFKGKELRVSPELSLSSVRKAAIVLHLLAILTAESTSPANIDRPFFSYLLDPLKSSRGYVLAKTDPSNKTPQDAANVILTCSCRTAFLRNDKQTTCPQCCKPCPSRKEEETPKSTCFEQDESSVCNMTPSNFRLLRILVNAALLAGISLDTFSKKTLAEFLSLEEEKGDPVEQCLGAIDEDLKVLKRLWGFNEEQVHSTIHLLIEETSSILTKPTGGPQLSDQSRKEMQKAFSDKVNQFFKSQSDKSQQNEETTNSPSVENQIDDQSRKEMQKAFPDKVNQSFKSQSDKSHQNEEIANPPSVENQIDEKDFTGDFDLEKRNLWLPRLFRFTKQKSLDDLCACYNKASDCEKEKHSLLGLFVQYMKVLPKIGHLYPLIKFSNMLESHFGRRLSRKDSEKLVGDVIKGDHHTHKGLKKAMKEFLSSWEIVRSVIEGDSEQEVPHLTEMSSVSYFLVDQGSYGQYLHNAILALQRIQNEFQGNVLKLALKGSCPALDFLKKSDSSSSLPIIHVQDVKQAELISFEWDDDILQYSYNDTEYGKGHEVHYDYGKIESELAGRFLIGKVYLSSDGGLRQFPYSNELFHTCENVLNDISKRLPQKPINADQQNRLAVLKDKRIKSVQDLLDHLEVIICWLSKTSYFGPEMIDMPLIDYVKRKLPSSNLLPKGVFEDPHKEFKLCHVVSMYQKLEEFLAEASVETVPDKYRKKMSEEALQKLSKVYGSVDEKMVVINTLRRFIFRYLLSDQDHDTHDPQENAVKYFSDPSLWPLNVMSGTDDEDYGMASEFEKEENKSTLKVYIDKFIPRTMLVCEVHSVMSFYDNSIKETKQKQIQQQTSPRKPMTRSKAKLAAKFKSGFA